MNARPEFPVLAAPSESPASTIIPSQQPALRTLMVAMSIMCYLASLAIGGLLLVTRAVESWTSDIAREVTVQVQPIEGRDTEAELQRAADLLGGLDGVARARVLGSEATAELLEPWLGKGRLIEELPVPRLIAVEINSQDPPDFRRMEEALKAAVPGASLDTHRQWQDELTRLATGMSWFAIAILLVVAVSAVTLVIQVTRTALDANREAVEVLHLVGAKDLFIAAAVGRRFLVAGVIAGLAGAAGAMATFGALSLAGYAAAPDGLRDASLGLIFGPSGVALSVYLWFLAVPVLATAICLITARFAVLRILREMF